MPRLELSLELEPTQPEERVALPCLGCGRAGCEWKLQWPLGVDPGPRGLHTQCKISFEQRRVPSRTFQAVKPP
jgi:hypothetical protein